MNVAGLGREFSAELLTLFFYTKFKHTTSYRHWRCSGRRKFDNYVYRDRDRDRDREQDRDADRDTQRDTERAGAALAGAGPMSVSSTSSKSAPYKMHVVASFVEPHSTLARQGLQPGMKLLGVSLNHREGEGEGEGEGQFHINLKRSPWKWSQLLAALEEQRPMHCILAPPEYEHSFHIACLEGESKLGMMLSPQLLVAEIMEGGLAHRAGVRLGMRLMTFQGRELGDLGFEEAMKIVQTTPRPWLMVFDDGSAPKAAKSIREAEVDLQCEQCGDEYTNADIGITVAAARQLTSWRCGICLGTHVRTEAPAEGSGPLWTLEEDAALKELVGKHGAGLWTKISADFPTNRSESAIRGRYKALHRGRDCKACAGAHRAHTCGAGLSREREKAADHGTVVKSAAKRQRTEASSAQSPLERLMALTSGHTRSIAAHRSSFQSKATDTMPKGAGKWSEGGWTEAEDAELCILVTRYLPRIVYMQHRHRYLHGNSAYKSHGVFCTEQARCWELVEDRWGVLHRQDFGLHPSQVESRSPHCLLFAPLSQACCQADAVPTPHK